MGEFDALIQQELMRNRSQRGEDPNQRARDFAARQMNARNGGPQSTAWAEANRAPVVADNPQDAPGLPAQAPVPASNPMNEAIEAQLAQEMGDGSVMEAMQGVPQNLAQKPAAPAAPMGDAGVAEAMQSPMEQAIAAQVGEEAPAPAAPAAPIDPGPGGVVQDDGSSLAKAGMLAASMGSGAAALKLYQAYQAGDPNATAIFKANGVDPEDFSMFVTRDAAVDRGGNAGTPANGGKQAPTSRANANKNTVQKAPKKSEAPKPKDGKSGGVKTKMPDQTSAPMPPWMKPKAKVK